LWRTDASAKIVQLIIGIEPANPADKAFKKFSNPFSTLIANKAILLINEKAHSRHRLLTVEPLQQSTASGR